ncbi:MAG: thioredoxin family protein [Azospirillum brasilense]|nr:MAG: thioredoxin family protein [Azospirillum brasilense]
MRTKLTIALAALLFSSASMAAPAPTAKVGEAAPNFKTIDAISGKEFELEKLKGKPVVLEWNNFGCPFVKKHYGSGNMQAVQKAAEADGAAWVSINSSAEGKEGFLKDAEAVKAALTEHKASPTAYLLDHDGQIGRAYGATATPHMFVIDKDGVLAYAGAIDDKPTPNPDDVKTATNYVTTALAALKAGKKHEPAQTKAYGCGVKYAF